MISRRGIATVFVIILVITTGVGLVLNSISSNRGSQYNLHVTQADGNISSDEVVQFDELTSGQQDVFEAALSQGNTNVPDDVSIQIWVDNRYVQYQNQTYRVAVSTA